MSRALEVSRLRRALVLQVEPIAGGYRVSGGRWPRDVLEREGRFACGCEDQIFHPDLTCKHVLASVLRQRLGAKLYDAVRDAVRGDS